LGVEYAWVGALPVIVHRLHVFHDVYPWRCLVALGVSLGKAMGVGSSARMWLDVVSADYDVTAVISQRHYSRSLLCINDLAWLDLLRVDHPDGYSHAWAECNMEELAIVDDWKTLLG
jgi:hypothetical protein